MLLQHLCVFTAIFNKCYNTQRIKASILKETYHTGAQLGKDNVTAFIFIHSKAKTSKKQWDLVLCYHSTTAPAFTEQALQSLSPMLKPNSLQVDVVSPALVRLKKPRNVGGDQQINSNL